MRKTYIALVGLFVLTALCQYGCVAPNPLHPTIIEETRAAVQAEYAEDDAKIDKILIFEYTLKVYMADDFPAERLTPFAKAITRAFGESMRSNKILSGDYYVSFFQKKTVDDKTKMMPIAECRFHNAADKVTVKDLGLGSGKYDAY